MATDLGGRGHGAQDGAHDIGCEPGRFRFQCRHGLPLIFIYAGAGLLVAPDDPGALAGAIACLLDDPELRARLGAAGRERVMSRFTWQITAAGTAACYEAVMAGETLPGAPTAVADGDETPLARGAA